MSLHRKLEIRSVGNSLGVIIPKEALSRLHLKKGDAIFMTETPSGINLSILDEEVQRQVEIGLEFMKEYREALQALAK